MGRKDSDPQEPTAMRKTPKSPRASFPGSGRSKDPARSATRLTALGESSPANPKTTLKVEAIGPRTPKQVRAIRPEETAMVETGTAMLNIAAEVSHDIPAERALVAPQSNTMAVATATDDEPKETVFIRGVKAEPARPLPRKNVKRRHSKTVRILAVVGLLAVVSVVLIAVRPIFGRSPAAQALLLSAAGEAVNPNNPIPTGPFSADAGAATTLGIGGGAGPGVNAPGSAGLPVTGAKNDSNTPGAVALTGISAAPVSPWPPSDAYMFVPGHGAFTMSYPSDGFYGWAFGQCTWWAQDSRRDENLTHMGNARYWAGGAASRGYTVSSVPRANATVVFQPGVQGAGGAGHVAHVVAVYPDGWFLISEMNFYWNGGGWGKVDYRFAHSGWGVQFIY